MCGLHDFERKTGWTGHTLGRKWQQKEGRTWKNQSWTTTKRDAEWYYWWRRTIDEIGQSLYTREPVLNLLQSRLPKKDDDDDDDDRKMRAVKTYTHQSEHDRWYFCWRRWRDVQSHCLPVSNHHASCQSNWRCPTYDRCCPATRWHTITKMEENWRGWKLQK